MAKLIAPLTTKAVRSLQIGEVKRDGRGLIFTRLKSGAIAARLRYKRPVTRKENVITLAKYITSPDLTEARRLASDARAALASGRDPQSSQAPGTTTSFEAMALEWLGTRKRIKSAKTLHDRKARLSTHLLAHVGTIPIDQINARDIAPHLLRVANDGKRDLASRLCNDVKEISVYAVATGSIEADKMAGLHLLLGLDGGETTKRHPAIMPQQLPEFLGSIFNASIKLQTRDCVLLQLHLMARPGEIVRLKWEHVGDEAVTFPAEIMKLPRDHVVPLSPQVKRLLQGIRSRVPDGCGWVFPAARKGALPHMNPESNNKAIQRAGWKGTLVAHGLRSLATTALQDDGFPDHLIDLALSHASGKSGGVSPSFAAYARSTRFEERRHLNCRWSEMISIAAAEGLKL